jgi:two-component system response regulator HydG
MTSGPGKARDVGKSASSSVRRWAFRKLDRALDGYYGGAMQSRVLIVDDDRDSRLILESLLSSDGHACELVPDAAAALRSVESHAFDLVVSDVIMDGMSGLELLDRVKRSHPALPVVLVTGAGAAPQAVDAIKRGAFQYLAKPYDSNALRNVVRDALEARRHSPHVARSARAPSEVAPFELVGSGPAMRTLQTAIDFVARSSAPILVTGETGSGKELVARAIHARGSRGHQPFVAVNMAAIPKELLEAELFGHVRGAFTGAVQPRRGLFMEAAGGTLLLDEVGDMPFALQAKLLRVLQFGEVRPVGSEHTHSVDVRVIAATHRDLPALVKEGRFREDLYFRLNVLPVRVPPLREHSEDIPALVEHFLADALRRAPSSPVREIGPDALRILTESSWPGNVRELASSIERAVVFGVDVKIDVNHLSPVPTAADAGGWPFQSGAPWTLRRLSRAYTEWVLAWTDGDKVRAAEILGINLSTLYRWQHSPKN